MMLPITNPIKVISPLKPNFVHELITNGISSRAKVSAPKAEAIVAGTPNLATIFQLADLKVIKNLNMLLDK